MYGDSALGRAVHIVATEHLTDNSTLFAFIRYNSLIQIHFNITSCRSSLTDGNLFCFRSSARISDVIYATLTATKHATEIVILCSIIRINDLRSYSTTIDIQRCVLSYHTYFATAVDATLDGTACHVQNSLLTLTKL